MEFLAFLYYLTASAFILAISIITYMILLALYNIYLHPLRYIPGDKLWSASRFPYLISMLRGSLHQDMHSMHTTFGPIIRLAPNELSCISPQAWKDIYSNRPDHLPFERNRVWFRKQAEQDPNSIMGPDEADHARFRKVLVNAFSDKALREQAPIIDCYVSLFIQHLKELSRKGEAVNLVEWLNFITFDIAGDLCFGESFKNLENGKAHPWVEISYDFGKGLAMVASMNYLSPLDKLMKYLISEKARQRMIDHKQMTKEKVSKRLENQKPRKDFIATILEQGDLKQERAMSREEMDINMSVLIFAGSETTASGLTAIVLSLLQNPACLEKVVEEIRSAFRAEEEINLASAGKLRYLNACIDEGMRLCPPVTIGVPRVVPEGGDTVDGIWIPGGTLVTVNQFPTFRSTTNFPHPNAFIPERFLSTPPRSSTTAPEINKDDTSAYHPFGIGRHSCIGQNLAYAEMRLVLAKLFWNFDLFLKDRGDGDVCDWGEQRTFIFWEKKGLWVSLKEK